MLWDMFVARLSDEARHDRNAPRVGQQNNAALFFELQEASRHESRHAFFDCGEILRFANTARQAINPARAGQGVHQRPRDEVISPENVFFGMIGQGALQDAYQLQHNRIEVLVHQLCPFRRVADARAEGGIVHPLLTAFIVKVQIRI
eukprot:GHVR01189940.1.p2 GENE.GHVR01189940.1~~GHVR01189940.1.p2  ORF type:complete len:147 (+),score=19.24 GHVR01189940.1:764-1204(+)